MNINNENDCAHNESRSKRFDCCHQISAGAAVVALCLNPVSMVINWGLMVFTLEERRQGCRNALIAVIAANALLDKLGRGNGS